MKGIGGENINFPIPDKRTLLNCDQLQGVSTDMQPGTIDVTLDLIPPGTIVKIAVDGKKLNQTVEQEL